MGQARCEPVHPWPTRQVTLAKTFSEKAAKTFPRGGRAAG
jgi:hypothetical protein